MKPSIYSNLKEQKEKLSFIKTFKFWWSTERLLSHKRLIYIKRTLQIWHRADILKAVLWKSSKVNSNSSAVERGHWIKFYGFFQYRYEGVCMSAHSIWLVSSRIAGKHCAEVHIFLLTLSDLASCFISKITEKKDLDSAKAFPLHTLIYRKSFISNNRVEVKIRGLELYVQNNQSIVGLSDVLLSWSTITAKALYSSRRKMRSASLRDISFVRKCNALKNAVWKI